VRVKTTLDIPDELFRKAKARAAERGESLRDFVSEALRARLAGESGASDDPPWMAGFGALRHLRSETRRIQALIDEEFGQLEPEDRQ
jgi:plasmid stability protein